MRDEGFGFNEATFLDLFRQSVTGIRLGTEIALPESLKREVQRSWHQKYENSLFALTYSQ